MTQFISFGNSKGGSGKTTTSALVAFSLAHYFKRRVLVIDFDVQNQQKLFFANDKINVEISNVKNGEVIINNLQYIDLITVGDSLLNMPISDFKLISSLKDSLNGTKYDFCIIDTPPRFGTDSIFGYAMSDFYIPVTETSKASFTQVADLDDSISILNQEEQLSIRKLGIIVNLKGRTKSDNKTLDLIKEKYNKEIINPILERRSKIRDFFDNGISVRYAEERRALEPFKKLTANILRKLEKNYNE